MDYSICSLNVRGLGQKTKRKQMFNFLEKNQFNICFLQETHSKAEVETLWTRESEQHIFFSGRSSTSGGVCILLEKSLQFKLIYHKEIIPGKIQALKLNLDDHDIVLINIYGPNNDDVSFFETLYDFLGENDDEEYEKLYTEQIVDDDKMEQMSKNISTKLNEDEKNIIEGQITE